ncbi:hypothetical protein [Salinibacter ruber]|uniref:hypothetical protein n=1 Tax=Salinibacter ruber TaxID=146919 RepID=UPI002167EF81|nr:hypothetical protein [Salinibacter ruber]MCS4152313.1 hypothetical protein [Salinibacter ruber]
MEAPGVRKTILVLQIAAEAFSTETPDVYMSFANSPSSLTLKGLGQAGNVNLEDIRWRTQVLDRTGSAADQHHPQTHQSRLDSPRWIQSRTIPDLTILDLTILDLKATRPAAASPKAGGIACSTTHQRKAQAEEIFRTEETVQAGTTRWEKI